MGVASIAIPGWAGAAGLAGAIFYLLAGGNHLLQGHRNRLENVAMVSDSFVGVVLAGALVLSMVR